MPTTKAKNFLYKTLLPFGAPDRGAKPEISTSGHPVREQKAYRKLIRKHHALGAATLIADGGNTAYLFSKSQISHYMPDQSTYYRVASITKMATSILTLHLADAGVLCLDTPVCRYLPGASLDSAMTLRHLLSHTSGLTDPPTLEKDLEEGTPLSEVIGRLPHGEPGKSFHYSNLGFGIIGCILEAVLDKPAGTIFEEYLFAPLNMQATLEGCTLPTAHIMPVTRIFPYRKGHEIILTPLGKIPLQRPDPLRHYGHTAGSMYATIDSLHTLLNLLNENNGNYLSDQALTEMKKRHAVYGKVSPTLSYGLGLLFIDDADISDHKIMGHQGFAYGCADGAFLEEKNGRIMITLNGGCSEARVGRLGIANRDMLKWAFRKELPSWTR